jgi:hypothetical protein
MRVLDKEEEERFIQWMRDTVDTKNVGDNEIAILFNKMLGRGEIETQWSWGDDSTFETSTEVTDSIVEYLESSLADFSQVTGKDGRPYIIEISVKLLPVRDMDDPAVNDTYGNS